MTSERKEGDGELVGAGFSARSPAFRPERRRSSLPAP
jgi:hypothetical protein